MAPVQGPFCLAVADDEDAGGSHCDGDAKRGISSAGAVSVVLDVLLKRG